VWQILRTRIEIELSAPGPRQVHRHAPLAFLRFGSAAQTTVFAAPAVVE
jgi:hypothetical protein